MHPRDLIGQLTHVVQRFDVCAQQVLMIITIAYLSFPTDQECLFRNDCVLVY